jgi:DNA-directed RNA polymerase subunit M/transcription elongation factor TFIIS
MARASAKSTKQTIQALLLTHTAEVKEIPLALESDATLTMKTIQAALKKKTAPELIGTYKYKSMGLFLFGFLTGKAGQENRHELPPPHDSVLLFGDILLVASKDMKSWKASVPFSMEEYEAFYTRAYGGFEDIDDDEDSEDEELEEEVEEEVEADADVEVEEVDVAGQEEEEEGNVEEEDSDEDEEEAEDVEEEVGVEDVEEEEPRVPLPKKRAAVAATGGSAVQRAKKSKRAAAGVSVTSQLYTNYLHVPQEDTLQPESFSSTDFREQAAVPQRQAMVRALSDLFKGLLTNEHEVNFLERCIYMAAIRTAGQRHVGKTWSHPPFVDIYKTVAKHISSNFYPNSYVGNKELFDRYKAGHISLQEISEADPYGLFETRWYDSIVAQQVREKRQLEGNKAMATDRFLCGRCHKRETTYYEMQTRSADEPMTIFITCLNCGKHWRQ